MASTQYYKDKVQLLMVELALSQCGEYARRHYEERIHSLQCQLQLLQKELETAYGFASEWADKYTRLLTTGKPDNFEAYNADGFSTGKIMPNRKKPSRT